MKKLLTTILVFLGFLALGANLSVKAAAQTESVDFSTQNYTNQQVITTYTGTNFEVTFAQGTSSNAPKYYTSGTAIRCYAKNTFTVASKVAETNISKITITFGSSDSTNEITVDTGELRTDVWNGDSASVTFTIGGTKGNRRIKGLTVVVGKEANYSIEFDANGGTYAEGKGTALSVPNGESRTFTLPTGSDFTNNAYPYTQLKGWNDGLNDFAAGAEVTVSSATKFTAVWEATKVLSIEEAIEVAEKTGSEDTKCDFSVEGLVKEIKKPGEYSYTVVITNADGTKDFSLFRPTVSTAVVGDYIRGTGKICKYNTTYELNAGCTYEVLVPACINNFPLTETKSSLKITYDAELNPTDVDLRLGGIIAANAYNANATYGVLVVEGTPALTAGKTEYATADAFIAANAGFKNVACTPVQVTDGYQFAWVITDMEGHYDANLTAVMYMIYDGVLYICSSKTTSVKATATEYLNDTTITLTDAEKAVLNKLIA